LNLVVVIVFIVSFIIVVVIDTAIGQFSHTHKYDNDLDLLVKMITLHVECKE